VVSIVVPALDAEATIGKTIAELVAWLTHSGPGAELIIVDDGSRDTTLAEVRSAFSGSSPQVTKRLLRNRVNRGKGHAVRRGLSAARGDRRVFIDADLAYPTANIDRLLAALDEGADLAIASRVKPGSRYVMSPECFRDIFFRHMLGRLFNTITRLTVVEAIRDTQAGLKAITGRAAALLLPHLQLERFSFDVELLYLAQRTGLRIDEIPVHFVYSGSPSTLALGQDGLRMLSDLVRIRLRGARGGYDRCRQLPSDYGPASASRAADPVSSE
jgi:dolichyl-phosphate beta-glucosyltransferase